MISVAFEDGGKMYEQRSVIATSIYGNAALLGARRQVWFASINLDESR
jgi:hypothetical protein